MARDGALIQHNNAEFAGLSAAEKRVAIAKDVIAWLELGRLVPESGTYLRTSAHATKLSEADQCHVCAIGAMFACLVERTPTLKFTDGDGYELVWMFDDAPDKPEVEYASGPMREALSEFFHCDQLALIESAFECDSSFYCDCEVCEDHDMTGCEAARAERFGRRYSTNRRRMKAIMENIIANDGEFIP